MRVIYRMEHLHCPRCAVRIEEKLKELEQIEAVRLSFPERLLHLTVSSTENLLEQVQKIAESIDSGVRVLDKQHSGHYHVREYAKELQKFQCSDPNCHCCDFITAQPQMPEEEISPVSEQQQKIVYDVRNIDCAACAVKIEDAVRKIPGIENASLSYTTGQLFVYTAPKTDGSALLPEIRKATKKVTEGVSYRIHKENRSPVQKEESHASEFIVLGIGFLFFVLGLVIHWTTHTEMLSNIFLLGAYILMGGEVLVNALKNILKGQIFDENFLMTIATAGALAVGSWEEAAGVMFFYRIGELFEDYAVERSRDSVMKAIDLRPETVQKISGETHIQTIPAEEVQIGDILLVRAGDRIPIDGIIQKGESRLDTSAITGESVPITVKPGNEVFSGSVNLNGVLEIQATAELKNSMVSRILDSVQNASAGKPKLDKLITRFSRIYTPVVVGIAVLTAIVPSLITGNWHYWIYTALNFLMISCPCALVLSVPLAFFSGIGAGSAKGILFKDGISLEALEKIKAVVMDKTGTLTKGVFTVTEAETVDCKTEQLFRICAGCECYSSHPVAKSILAYMEEQGITYEKAKMVRELAGRGIIGKISEMQVVCGNEKLMEEMEIQFPPFEGVGTCVYVAVNHEYYGRLVLSDMPKEHALETVQKLNRKKLYTVMLTGDSPNHAKAVANQLQVQEFHAGLLPTQKPEYLQEVRKQHGAVLFVGDGINDAPVLSGADVGMAMGSGADSALEASDIVLLGSDPESIVTSMEIAKRVNQTARFCIVFALAVKLAVMIFAFFGFVNMWVSVFADTGVTILCILLVLFRIPFYYRKNK